MESISPRSIKGYDLLELLGEGAYGAVYRARQETIDRQVAVKVILPQYANQPDFIRRFESEAQLIAQLEHLHIVPLYDYWRDPDGAYLVMRLMKGGSLANRLDGSQPWEPDDAVGLIDQVASALDAAHQKGVVHRDLKPANILLDEVDNAYLSDFGIAKVLGAEVDATQAETIVGTPEYITPEQVQSLPVTPQTDIYALGVLVYQLLVGEHPFPGSSSSELVVKHLQEPLPYLRSTHPDLPPALDDVIQRATSKDPSDRYPDAASLADDFRRALQLEAELPEVPEEDMYNPYKGLRAFQVADAADFFGREALTGQLLAHLATPGEGGRFLAVVGPSGSGKSSVVKAGLLPALQGGALPGSDQWFITEMQPGSQPLDELALALLSISVNPDFNLIEQLGSGEDGLVKAARSALPDDESQLLLLIDQFEELFSLVEDEDERSQFLELLHTAVTDPESQVRLALTLRADFYDRPLMHPHFGKLVEEHTVVVLPLTPEELESAIRNPAERAGAVLEDDLASAISSDVADQPGALPLLQYALTELFERREGRMLTHRAYQSIGGVLGALGRRAEEVYAGLDPVGKTTARQLFLRLVTLGEGAEDTRRRVLSAELASLSSDISQVIDIFGQARLLSFDHDPATRGPTVEVAHEALLREWRRLREWLNESRADIRMQIVLSNATADWIKGDQEASFLLRGARLAQFEVWAEETSLVLTPDERRFLEASLEFEAQRKAQQAALERRSRNFLRALVVVFAVAAIVAVGLTIFAFNQQGIAQDNAATAVAEADARATQQFIAEQESEARATQQAIAEDAQSEAELQASIAAENEAEALAQKAIVEEQALAAQRQADINQSRFLAAQSQLASQSDNRDLALALAMAATQIEDPPGEAQMALSEAAYTPGTIRQYTGHNDTIYASAFNPDGSTFWSASTDNTLRLWDIQGGEQIQQLQLPFSQFAQGAAVFSPDGNQALVALDDHSLVYMGLDIGLIIHKLTGHTSPITAIAISPDGTTALSAAGPEVSSIEAPADADFSIRLWDLSTGEEIHKFEEQGHAAIAVAYSPDGMIAVSATRDGSMILWNLETGEMLQKVTTESEESIEQVAFSPDGRRIISLFGDNTLIFWDIETGVEFTRLLELGAEERIHPTAAFSPDASQALLALEDHTLALMDMESGANILRISGHTSPVNVTAISPDGRIALSGSGNLDLTDGPFPDEDLSLRIWDLLTGEQIHQLTGHDAPIYTASFSADGSTILSASLDNTLRFWDVQTGEQVQQLQLPGNQIANWAAAINPNNQQALLGLNDHSLVLMDLESGELIQRMTGHGSKIMMVAISPDGLTALTGSGPRDFSNDPPPDADLSMRLWDLSTGEELRRFEGHTHSVVDLAYAPDGKTAVSSSWDGSTILWDLATGAQLQHMVNEDEEDANAVAFHPDGRRALAVSAFDAGLWDLETGQLIRKIGSHTGEITKLAISPDGRIGLSGDLGGEIKIWDLETGEELDRFINHNNRIGSFAFSPDGQTFISGSADNTLRLWSLGSGAEIQRFPDHIRPRSVAFSPDGRTALSIEESAMHHWDLQTGTEILRIDLPASGWGVAYTPDGGTALVVMAGFGDIIQYDLSSGEEIQRLGDENELTGHADNFPLMEIAISADGKKAFSGSQGGERTLYLWDLETGEELRAFEDTWVFGVDISPDGSTAISVNSDGGITLWDLTTGNVIRRYEGHDNAVWGVDYSPDGKTFLTGSWDGSMILWDLETGEILQRFLGHSDQVRRIKFSPDGRTAISSSRDGTLILWDLETGEALRRYRGHEFTYSVAFSPDGESVLSVGVIEGEMIQWRIDDTLEELTTWTEENRYVRELTCSERAQFNIQPLCEE